MEPFQLVAFIIIVFVGVRSSVASPTRTRLAYAGGASCPLSARLLCGLGFDMRDIFVQGTQRALAHVHHAVAATSVQ